MVKHWLAVLTFLGTCLSMSGAEVKVARTTEAVGESVTVDLGNGVQLGFAVEKGLLRGLWSARADGVALKSEATVVRPYVLQEWVDKPVFCEAMRLVDATADGRSARLKVELLGTTGDDAFRSFFVYAQDGPHYDCFRFAHVQLPSVVCTLGAQKERSTKTTAAKPVGTLTWVIEPAEQNIAGWPWKGWRQHYELELKDGLKVNCLRELGTWELGGWASGNTLVNLRYRGLGGIAARLEHAKEGECERPHQTPVTNAFTTTEILPNLMGKPPAVSPMVPGRQDIPSRNEAMKYRHGAWIAQLQRGGGVHWVDFQYQPSVGLISWYEKMAAIRSLTEVWPGDTQVSHYDGLYFPLTDRAATTAKHFLVLAPQNGLPEHEWHSRWQEVDQFARDWLCKDLDFKPQDALPSVGLNWDCAWEGRIRGLIGRVEELKQAGVKRILVHHPGWLNGRGLRQGETPHPIPKTKDGKPDTGGDCSIHDYVPQSPKVRELWIELTSKLKAADIQYWVWITGMVRDNGPACQALGAERFCRNKPGDTVSCGYPPRMFGISIRDPQTRKWWDERMDGALRELGVRGFWADSWQNMFMSQMNYQQPDWAPQVREWWEWVAEMSRHGAGFMAESTSLPGLSCSLEVGGSPHDFEGLWWVLPHTTRWYRGEPVPGKGTEKADRLYFRSMANKGPIAPGDGDVKQIPAYSMLSRNYVQALPAMRRPYQLPGQKGVLWFGSQEREDLAVLFAFEDFPEMVDVQCVDLGSRAIPRPGPMAAHRVYQVAGQKLRERFGVHPAPLPDPRVERAR